MPYPIGPLAVQTQDHCSFTSAWRLGIATFTGQYGRLVLIALVATVIACVIVLPMLIAATMSGPTAERGSIPPGRALAFLSTSFVLMVLVGSPLVIGVGYASVQAARGHVRVPDLFMGFCRYGRSLRVTLLLCAGCMVRAIAVAVPVVIVEMAVATAASVTRTPFGSWSTVVPVTAIALGAVALSWMMVRRLPAAVAAVDPAMDLPSAVAALDRSIEATRGLGWTMVGLAATATAPAVVWFALARELRVLEVEAPVRQLLSISLLTAWVLLVAPLLCAVYGSMHALALQPARRGPTPDA